MSFDFGYHFGFRLGSDTPTPPPPPPPPPDPDFVMLVKTDNAGTSGTNQFTIPTSGSGYNYTVTTSEQTLTGQTGNVTLTWATAGTYEVRISGTFPRIGFFNGGDRLKLIDIANWGVIKWVNFYRAFEGCSNLVVTANDVPDLSEMALTSIIGGGSGLRAKFFNSTSLTSVNYNGADFSKITMFGGATSPTGQFFGCTSLISVDFRNVTWNSVDGSDCAGWFQNAPVEEILGIENCNIKPTLLNFALNRCKMTPLNLSSMNTSLLTNAIGMLDGSDVVNVNCTGWDWSSVTNMAGFARSSKLQNIIGLTDGEDFTACTTFQVSFQNASDFNQLFKVRLRLAGVDLRNIFQNTSMSTANYTDTIVYWANYAFENSGTPINVNMSAQSGRTFDTSRSGGANFANAGAARTYLTTTLGWTISGDTVI